MAADRRNRGQPRSDRCNQPPGDGTSGPVRCGRSRTLRAGRHAPRTRGAQARAAQWHFARPEDRLTVAPRSYSGIVTRGLAFVVDAAIVNGIALLAAAATLLIMSVLPGSQRLHGLAVIIAGAVFILWCVTYWATFWATTGQTPGDRIMRVRVTRSDGSRLHVARALLRVGATALAALPLLAGFLPIMFND